MSDDALIAWLNAGAPSPVSETEAAARLVSEFSRRFSAAIRPEDDLGPDEESHEAAIAMRVREVHMDLNSHGEMVYSDVWRTLDAPTRRAIKAYVSMYK